MSETTETGLVVLNNSGLVQTEAQIGGLGLNTKSAFFELKPATVSIVQPNSTGEGLVKGNLNIHEAELQFKTMRVALLDTPVEKRSYYVGETGQLNRTPENLHCFCNEVVKNDYKQETQGPSAKAKYPQAQLCRTCPKSSWEQYRVAKEKGLGNLKDLIPPCDAYFYAAFVDTEYQMPLQMFIRSKSKDPFEAGMKNLARKLAMLQAKTKRVPNVFDVSFTLSTKLITTGKFPSYILQLSDFQGVTDEERESFGEIFASYRTQKLQYEKKLLTSTPEEAAKGEAQGAQTPADAQETIDSVVLEGQYVDTEVNTTEDIPL